MGKPKTIASKDLKAFLSANKRETRLMGAVERHVLSRPFDDRDMSYIHPSDVIKEDWCALAQYHAIKGNYVETRDKPTARLASIFAEGHSIHAKWQTWFTEMGVMFGKWMCSNCGFGWYGTSADLENVDCDCPLGVPQIRYKEVPLRSEKHMIRGHADGWIRGLGDDCLIEIKSIGSGGIRMEAPAIMAQSDDNVEKAWKNIKTPFRSHQLQGQVYLHLCHLMVEEDILESAPKEIVFIYELKANQEYKEFVVAYNPEYTKDIFDKCLDVAWAVKNSRPPLCNIDPEKGCKRCEPFRDSNE
jgi:hypothetical protein